MGSLSFARPQIVLFTVFVAFLTLATVLFVQQNQAMQLMMHELQQEVEQSRNELISMRRDTSQNVEQLQQAREQMTTLRQLLQENAERWEQDTMHLSTHVSNTSAATAQLADTIKDTQSKIQQLADQEGMKQLSEALKNTQSQLSSVADQAELLQLADTLKATQSQIARLSALDTIHLSVLDASPLWDVPLGKVERCPVGCFISSNITDNTDGVIGLNFQYQKGPQIRSYFPAKQNAYMKNIAVFLDSNKKVPSQTDKVHAAETDLIVTYSKSQSDSRNTLFSSFVNFAEGEFRFPPVTYKEKKQDVLAVAIVSDCTSQPRNKFISELMKKIKMDSIGSCEHSNKKLTDFPECESVTGTQAKKLCAMQSYKYYIAVENFIDVDYVTEELFGALEAGVVPVYYGAPNVDEFLPTTKPCIIKANEATNLDELATKLQEIAASEEQYTKYVSWKADKYEEKFQHLLDNSLYNLGCNMCLKVKSMFSEEQKQSARPFQAPIKQNSSLDVLQKLNAVNRRSQQHVRLHVQNALVNNMLLEGSGVGNSELRSDPEFPSFVSFPRTGSHWLRSVLELYFEQPLLVRTFFFPNRTDFLFYHDHDVALTSQPKNALYLYRDPISTIYSQMGYEAGFSRNETKQLNNVVHWATVYAKHLRKWLHDETFTSHKTIVNYERMTKKPMEEFPKIINFLYGLLSSKGVPFLTKHNVKELDPVRLQYILRYVTHHEIAQHTKHDRQVVHKYFKEGYLSEKDDFREKYKKLIWDIVLEQTKGFPSDHPIMDYFREAGYPVCNNTWHKSCSPQDYWQSVAIITPALNVPNMLPQFLNKMESYLVNTTHRIFVVEQNNEVGTLNRGKLMNAAFNTIKDHFSYFCFHDMDIVPVSGAEYTYSEAPVHLARNVEKFGYSLPYNEYVGGALCMKREDFEKMNGYSNRFWGQYEEDSETFRRMSLAGLTITSPYNATFNSIKHDIHYQSSPIFDVDTTTYAQVEKAWFWDGLSSLNYEITETKHYDTYTHYKINV